eukprot:402469-Prymnesium_polylepis.1
MTTKNSTLNAKLRDQPGGPVHTAYARYLRRFVSEYATKGVKVWALTGGNEPAGNTGKWQDLKFTAEEQRDFVKTDLGPALEGSGVKCAACPRRRVAVTRRYAPLRGASRSGGSCAPLSLTQPSPTPRGRLRCARTPPIHPTSSVSARPQAHDPRRPAQPPARLGRHRARGRWRGQVRRRHRRALVHGDRGLAGYVPAAGGDAREASGGLHPGHRGVRGLPAVVGRRLRGRLVARGALRPRRPGRREPLGGWVD